MPKTFRDLDEAEEVTPAELIETMRDYVDTRSGISPHAVKEIIRKTGINGQNKEELLKLAEKAVDTVPNTRTAAEYQQVVDYLRQS